MIYANIDDLERRCGPLQDEERDKALVLLEDASALVEASARGRAVNEAVARSIVCKAVKRALSMDEAGSAVRQQSMTVGSYNMQTTYVNPCGDLYFTRKEEKLLYQGGQRAASVQMWGVAE